MSLPNTPDYVELLAAERQKFRDYRKVVDAELASLSKALTSKIGPDWREALPYESELELREVIVEFGSALKRLRDLVELGLTPCPYGQSHTITGEEATNAVIAADLLLRRLADQHSTEQK